MLAAGGLIATAACSGFRDPSPQADRDNPAVILPLIERSVSSSVRTLPANIFPGPPLARSLAEFQLFNQEGGLSDIAVSLDEPDDIDPGGTSDISSYSLPDEHYFVYALSKVNPVDRARVLKRLLSLSRTHLYGFYDVIPRTEAMKQNKYAIEISFYTLTKSINIKDLPGIRPVKAARARYSREITLSGGALRTDGVYSSPQGDYRFPTAWQGVISSETLIRMWVECAVAVSKDGLPIDAPLRHVRPIALETGSALYLSTQKIERSTAKHGYFVQFNGAAFRLLGKPISPSAIETLMSGLFRHLKLVMAMGPLQADEDRTSPLPPGEFHFHRNFQPSVVLRGFRGPYKELSYYNVRWWRMEDERRTLYTLAPAIKGGFGAAGDRIVIQVSHSLTISVGASNEYSEPTPDQIAKYQVAISTTMQNALKGTAAEFKGTGGDADYYDIPIAALNGR
jgi:hypothetical protein